jgi:hypothetical protein
MKAKILAKHPAPPGSGASAWTPQAIIDVELLVNLLPVVIRGITVRTKEDKTFFGFKSYKRDETWEQVVDFPEHGKQVQDALLEAWRDVQANPAQLQQPQQTAPLQAMPMPSHPLPSSPKPARRETQFEDCPF